MPEAEKPKPTTTQSETQGTKRPGNGNIYCLLVGINQYQNAPDHIGNLKGCIEDLNTVERWLHQQFQTQKPEKKPIGLLARISTVFRNRTGEETDRSPNGKITTYNIPIEGYRALKICRLEDEKATYEGIIYQFEHFLAEAGESDRVWFHFSGHGTEAPTAQEFLTLEDGKDQCLICHDFTENPAKGTFSNVLADKELAVLLHKITHGENGTPHVLVTIDSCHSGGATRDDADFMERGTTVSPNARIRALSSYFDQVSPDSSLKNYYQKLDQPKIPFSPHVVITACSNLEKAGERKGGFFTNGLIEALKMVNGEVNYADLQVRTRSVVQRLKSDQTPQFQVLGGVKAYARFLEGTDEGDPERYEIKNFSGVWAIALGAIHGLPADGTIKKVATTGKEAATLKIYEFGASSTDEPVATARLAEKGVGPMYSVIELISGKLENKDKTYFGMLDFFPAEPEFILLSGKKADVDQFEQRWLDFDKIKSKNIHYLKKADPGRPHSFEVEVNGHNLKIKNLAEGRYVDKDYSDLVSGVDPAEEVLGDLLKIVKWQRLLELQNENNDSPLKDKVELKVELKGKDEQLVSPEKISGDLHKSWIIKATEDNSLDLDLPGRRFFQMIPSVEIKGATDKLYFYLFKLHGYGILAHENPKSIGRQLDGQTLEYTSFGWGINPDEDRDIYYFKLIVTTKELDYHQLLQSKIKDGDRADEVIMVKKTMEDWYATTLKIELIRE